MKAAIVLGLFGVLFNSVCAEISLLSCVGVMNDCLLRRMCYPRVRDLEIGCCRKSFVDGNFSIEKQKECVEAKMGSDVEDCTNAMGSECIELFTSFASEKMEKFLALEQSIFDTVGFPNNAEECESFFDRLEKEELDRCIRNDDEDLVWACDLVFKIMENTPLAQCSCEEDFINCMSSTITESEAQQADIDCCREIIGNKTSYYDLKEACIMRKLHSKFVNCIKPVRKECTSKVISNLLESKDSIEEFKNTVQEYVGVPTNVFYCKRYYIKGKDTALKMCRDNVDEKLRTLCTILQHIFEPSSELKRKIQQNKHRFLKDSNEV